MRSDIPPTLYFRAIPLACEQVLPYPRESLLVGYHTLVTAKSPFWGFRVLESEETNFTPGRWGGGGNADGDGDNQRTFLGLSSLR